MTTQAFRICRSKKKYKTIKDAAIFQAHVCIHHHRMQHVYECPECGAYHLTDDQKEQRHYNSLVPKSEPNLEASNVYKI